jgi:exodeoxyribonuclease VII large subunit
VVSAIGHEPDAPILDLVADVRAATPTDAGKRIVPDWHQELAMTDQAVTRLRRAVVRQTERELAVLEQLSSRPALRAPAWIVASRFRDISGLKRDNRRATETILRTADGELTQLTASLAALSPQGTLDRGYALVTKNNRLVSDAAKVAPADSLCVRVAHGSFAVEVLGSQARPG